MKEYTYYAFISYKREDEKWAKWLQKKLESYGFPVALRKDNPTLPSKIRPVFRDQSDLSGGNLRSAIENGLRGSKYLIVICSPRAAQSPWVSKEVQFFIDNGRENNIIPFIIGGSPNAENPEEECFPEGLRQLSGEKEILGININEMGRDAAAIKVIARMFGLRFDTLWQRHERAKRRMLIGWGIIAAIVIAVITGVAIFINSQNLALESKNLELKQANDTILAERDRANKKTEEALRANKSLEIANDSIQYQSELLILSNDSLTKINNVLSSTIRDLNIERNKVALKSLELQKEQLRLISNQAELLFDEGNVLRSYQLIRPKAIEIINGNYPYSPEVASLINKIKWHLNEEGYKVIEKLMTSESDSIYVSPDLGYNPYTERGKFYLRDVRKGLTTVLPGEDRIDDSDIQFGHNTIYYRGVGNSYLWDITKEERIKFPMPYYSNCEDYEYFMDYTLPDIIYPLTKHIQSYDDIPDIIDYDISVIVEKNGMYIASTDEKEILVGNKLLSKRILPVSFDSGIIGSSIYSVVTKEDESSDSISYDGLTWHMIDEKGPLRLYKWSEYGGDATDARLLLKNDSNHSNFEFTPFVAYSIGNGIGYLETAFILNENEILCVSGQTNHEIYNIKSGTRTVFQSGTIDGWKMAHIGLYLANAFLLDSNTLCDVRNNGQITIYDIPSRLVIDEYDIPVGGWLRNGNLSERVFHKGNRIIIVYDDCSYEITLGSKLQSLTEDIYLIDQFWN